ncbi:stage III sporulation protein SpoIIIAB [Paenibacillus farraposensis]|uniref:Stage III sporulation protein SpoIIIAB n=1 Tax=Paenibacillus farraposensis TaxID=2807095 RepID=A0ABW4DE45_9BACL|nr:stage III sporulation protein SpoIIIAB [Paenibacillus farraposensis]MCC3379731.1 stage III sporulation protein AB [Paenibacillus farraposensis]
MLKLLGAALILLAATLAGWQRARQFAMRPRQIRELILALQRLTTEVSYGVSPLPDAFAKTGEPLREPLRTLFMQASRRMHPSFGLTAKESLHQAIEDSWGRSAMQQAEKEAMRQLAYSLGTSDREDQIKHIALTIQQLSHEEAQAQADQVRYERMSRSLGLLIGALIVILIY